MYLKKEQIDRLSHLALIVLEQKKLIELHVPRDQIIKSIHKAITDVVDAEEKITYEAETLLKQYASKMGASFDREKMLQLIRKELTKKYKLDIE